MDDKWEVPPSTELDQLLDRVAQGESVELTRAGKTIAKIVPNAPTKQDARMAAVERLLAMDVSLDLAPGTTIKDLISEGRR